MAYKTTRDREQEARAVKVKVLQMEVDYHLLSLFDAIQADDQEEITKQKRILKKKCYQLESM